jgi:hypothetical protein
MRLSYVPIANLSLGHIGEDDRISDPDEDKRAARAIKTAWEGTRLFVLSEANWAFAIRTVELTARAAIADWPIALGRTAFPLPADLVTLVAIVDPDLDFDNDLYSIEGGPERRSSSRRNSARSRFATSATAPISPIPSRWSPGFAEAFAFRLAWQISDALAADKARKDRAFAAPKSGGAQARQAHQCPDEGAASATLKRRGRPLAARLSAGAGHMNGDENREIRSTPSTAARSARRMEGRSDLDGIYDRAVAKMLNYRADGRRAGDEAARLSLHRRGGRDVNLAHPVRVQHHAILCARVGREKVRFYTNDGLIGGNGVTVPYTAAEAPRVSTKQSFDRLYCAHSKYAPGMLTRTDATTFTYEKIPLKNGPFKDLNTDKSKTVAWSGSGAVGGVATIDSTSSIFLPGHVGAAFMFEVEGFNDVPAWEPTVRKTDSLIVGSSLRRADGRVYMCVAKVGIAGGQYTGTIQPTHTSGAEWDGSGQVISPTDNDVAGVRWQYMYDRFGDGRDQVRRGGNLGDDPSHPRAPDDERDVQVGARLLFRCGRLAAARHHLGVATDLHSRG